MLLMPPERKGLNIIDGLGRVRTPSQQREMSLLLLILLDRRSKGAMGMDDCYVRYIRMFPFVEGDSNCFA